MIHLPTLIQDLALILIAAGIVTVLFKKIGQPIVLGYIIAGALISSHPWFLPTVTDLPNIKVWAEIGVIFLLFSLGLEFSFKKLVSVGGPASVAAITEIIGMVILGYLSAKFFGWKTIDGLFLGGILAISSTTIIMRTIHETGMKGRGFVEFVFGILIVEDLVAVLLLVLLSTVAITNQVSGEELLYSTLKLAFFVVFAFLSGFFILPTILKSIRKILNDEMLLIVSLALCFLTVTLSTSAGFSPALGAFIMGSILAETSEVKKIEHLILPLKDLFGAIFFVSVGMLINPQILIEYIGPIIFLTAVTILGKFFSVIIGSIISRRSIRHSIQAGLSLAQIGEFSFIIAGLGISINVTSSFLYPIAVGVSVITTFITPYLIRNIDIIYLWIEKCLPMKAQDPIKKELRYSGNTLQQHEILKKNIYSSLVLIVLNSVIISSIFYFIFWVFNKKMNNLVLVLVLILTSPFLWAILFKKNMFISKGKKGNIAFIFLEILRFITTSAIFCYIATFNSSNAIVIVLSLLMTLVLLFLLSPPLKYIYEIFEKHLLKNIFEKDFNPQVPTFGPWDAHISYLIIPAESEVAGKTLHELKIRENFGASIALIERGHLFITAPGRDEKLFPNDRVAVIGNNESVIKLTNHLKSTKTFTPNTKVENYALYKILVTDKMSFAFKTIRKSSLREKTDGLIIGIERHGEKILNPDSMLKILPDDLLWIVGDGQKIKNIT